MELVKADAKESERSDEDLGRLQSVVADREKEISDLKNQVSTSNQDHEDQMKIKDQLVAELRRQIEKIGDEMKVSHVALEEAEASNQSLKSVAADNETEVNTINQKNLALCEEVEQLKTRLAASETGNGEVVSSNMNWIISSRTWPRSRRTWSHRWRGRLV